MLQTNQSFIPRRWAEARVRPAWLGYAVSVAAVAVAFMITTTLPAIQDGSPFMFFYLAVTISALVGGLRAGILAIALSFLVVGIWIFAPIGQFAPSAEEQVRLMGFLF